MDLTILRKQFTPVSTIGDLLVDSAWECYVLEDPVRPPGVKIPGNTAIPYTTKSTPYPVIIDESDRFKRLMPHILNVPMFKGIRIHWGNSAFDTEGCPILGKTRGKNWVGNSKKAFDEFFSMLEIAIAAGEKIQLEILEGEPYEI